MMPSRSGIALYQDLKLDPELRRIPVVFVSAFSRSSDVGPASFRKVIPDERVPVPEAYIEKPVVIPEFLETVARLIDSARSGTPTAGGRAP
jgi:CheY-like chemotaxis protein